jgi:hypothetical protein
MRSRTTTTFVASDNNNSFAVAFHSAAHRHALKTTTTLSALIDDTSTTTSSTSSSLYFDPSTVVTPGVFEPVLNIEATVSFTIIAILFALLQYRINAVTNAATRRSTALVELRQAESLQLSNPTSDTNVVITRAKNEYESALRQELRLRTILPGVRIAAPNDAARSEEDRAAAKRFLGWKNEDFGYDVDAPTIDEKAGSSRVGNNNIISSVEKKEEIGNGLSSGSKLILAGVASMLIVLLWTLSFDPMTAATTTTDTNVFG